MTKFCHDINFSNRAELGGQNELRNSVPNGMKKYVCTLNFISIRPLCSLAAPQVEFSLIMANFCCNITKVVKICTDLCFTHPYETTGLINFYYDASTLVN